MRLDELRPAHVRRAVAVYLELAWPPGSVGKPPLSEADLAGAKTLSELFARCDRPLHEDEGSSQRYTLRLGNHRYPFMKFVVQEYLVDGEYFFSVDTHDDISIGPENPDYAGWLAIKRFNADLKTRIERRWKEDGLPTHEDLRILAEGLARVERESEKRARLLVVDDEQDVAQGVRALLVGRGYEVECCYDGREVLERLQRDPLPDLVVLDYAMPELDGQSVLAEMRRDPRLVDLPVLLTTASSIELSEVQRASGLLRKPYPRALLFAMLGRLLERK